MDDDLSLYIPYHAPGCGTVAEPEMMARIRYAEELRLQIREAYLARPTPSPALWLVDVD